MIALAFLLSGAAQAQTYSVDFAIPMTTPVNLGSNDEILAFRQWGVASGYSDQTISSSWSYIDCEIVDESVHVVFSATPATWPTSFPSTATCTGGGYTLVLNLEDSNTAPDGDMSFVPANGIDIALGTGVGTVRTFELPSGPSYVEGLWKARLNQTTIWTGVKCSVSANSGGDHYLQVYVTMSAAADDGYCVLPSGTIPHFIPLTITR